MQKRKTTTKDDIRQAFILLLSKNNLNDISVSQLTKKQVLIVQLFTCII